jgi:hypothetical protein
LNSGLTLARQTPLHQPSAPLWGGDPLIAKRAGRGAWATSVPGHLQGAGSGVAGVSSPLPHTLPLPPGLSFPTQTAASGDRGFFKGTTHVSPATREPRGVSGSRDPVTDARPAPAWPRPQTCGPAPSRPRPPRPRGSGGSGAVRGSEPARRVDCPESAAGAPRGEGGAAGGPRGGGGMRRPRGASRRRGARGEGQRAVGGTEVPTRAGSGWRGR